MELNLLSKGLNFIPTPRRVIKTPILEASNQFARRLKLTYHFRNSRNFIGQKFLPKSTWVPPEKNIPPIILETIQNIDRDISNMQIPKHKSNLTKTETEALKKIRNDPRLIIKSADKGAATVIMNRESYTNEVYRQLNDEKYYKKISEPIFKETAIKINDILYDLHVRHFITEKQYTYLKAPAEPRPRVLYALPKIHKNLEKWTTRDMPPGRPIISDCSSESYATAEYIEHFLKPLANKHDAFLKDTLDFLNKIKQETVAKDDLLVTFDVVSMYPNICHQMGLAAIKDAFQNNPDPRRPDDEILKLLEINLKCNDFTFNDETFLQLTGTAMGKRFAPSLANIFMAQWESQILKKCYLKPKTWRRFLDDIFCIWPHGRENLKIFLDILNSHHPDIKLTATVEETAIDFLDVTVFKSKERRGKLDTKVYFKETDTHALLNKASFHPKHTFRGILK